MVVLIRNLQKRIVLNIPLILQNANTLVDILRINHFDVNLVFVGKGFIKSLNLRYRRRNVTTDVLAFPYLQVRSSKRKGPFFLVVTIKFSNVQCSHLMQLYMFCEWSQNFSIQIDLNSKDLLDDLAMEGKDFQKMVLSSFLNTPKKW